MHDRPAENMHDQSKKKKKKKMLQILTENTLKTSTLNLISLISI